jgi:hypothetical protein
VALAGIDEATTERALKGIRYLWAAAGCSSPGLLFGLATIQAEGRDDDPIDRSFPGAGQTQAAA